MKKSTGKNSVLTEEYRQFITDIKARITATARGGRKSMDTVKKQIRDKDPVGLLQEWKNSQGISREGKRKTGELI